MNAQLSKTFAAVLMMGVFAGAAHAGAGYCLPGTSFESTYVTNAQQNTTQTVTISTSDVTFNGFDANDCYGVVEGNDTLGLINGIDNWGPLDFSFLAKDPTNDPNENPGSFGGFSFSLDSSTGTPGEWTLTVSPTAGLPIYLDFVVVLKGSPAWAAYFFDDAAVTAGTCVSGVCDGVNPGTYTMVIKNNGGEIAGLSHMSIYVREGRIPREEIPEPGVLFLMGAGLLGLGMARRRKSA